MGHRKTKVKPEEIEEEPMTTTREQATGVGKSTEKKRREQLVFFYTYRTILAVVKKEHVARKMTETIVLFFSFFNNTGVIHTWISRSTLGTVAHSTGVTDLFPRGSGVEDLLHLSSMLKKSLEVSMDQ
jgi:hypothetical protein